jgi:hypothetical protein
VERTPNDPKHWRAVIFVTSNQEKEKMALKKQLSIAPYAEQTAEHDGLETIAESIRYAANVLGTGNAATPMGALELLAKETLDGTERIAAALLSISEALEGVASAIRETQE